MLREREVRDPEIGGTEKQTTGQLTLGGPRTLSVLLAMLFVYFWLLPLVRPRGQYLWGHYRLTDIYLGIPIGLAALAAGAVALIPRKRRRGAALRFSTVVLAVLVTVYGCDAVYTLTLLRLWPSDFWLDSGGLSRSHTRPDPELGYIFRPYLFWQGRPTPYHSITYRTDADGFRNPSGLARADVVFLGDSFTEAPQVQEEDTYVRRFGALEVSSVVNLGRCGYGPQQEEVVLRRYALKYAPRVVVWQLYEGNDLSDARHYWGWKEHPGGWRKPFLLRYLDRSLINLLLGRTVVNRALSAMGWVTIGNPPSQPFRLCYSYQPDEPRTDALGMAETERALADGQRLCHAHGIRLVVLFVPTQVRVLGPYLRFKRPGDRALYLPLDGRDTAGDFRDRTARACRQLGVGFADAFPALRREAAREPRGLYLYGDEHLDLRGHRIVSELLNAQLRTPASGANREGG